MHGVAGRAAVDSLESTLFFFMVALKLDLYYLSIGDGEGDAEKLEKAVKLL